MTPGATDTPASAFAALARAGTLGVLLLGGLGGLLVGAIPVLGTLGVVAGACCAVWIGSLAGAALPAMKINAGAATFAAAALGGLGVRLAVTLLAGLAVANQLPDARDTLLLWVAAMQMALLLIDMPALTKLARSVGAKPA